MKGCMRAMVAQLKSESEDLQQVSSAVTMATGGKGSGLRFQVVDGVSVLPGDSQRPEELIVAC